MEFRWMEYATEVARRRSFTKAAAQLHVAQPSLSQQIAKLEQELGVTLFYRQRGSVEATPDGVRFVEQAEQILRMRDDLLREMRERAEGVGRELVLGAPAITGGRVLPPLLRLLEERYPQIRVRLVEETTERLEHMTARGGTDLSVLALPLEDDRLAIHPLLTEPLYLAVGRECKPWMSPQLADFVAHAAASSDSVVPCGEVRLSEFARAPFIMLKQGYGFRRTVLGLCAESGFQPYLAYETSSIETAQAMAAHGLGVTLVPAMVAGQLSQAAPLYALPQGHPTRTLVFAYRADRYLSLAARALLTISDEWSLVANGLR
ncbi:MAG: LysR family transcriptional regulator [Firmicutes bacterium]|nr:LysR family transcriptional regulator [Bacillota bacterium]